MPTLVKVTVKETGGDYSLPSLAVAAIPSDIVAADEVWDIEIYEKVGGYNDQITMPSINTDATRFPRLYAAPGHEYNPSTGQGVVVTRSANFNGTIRNDNCDYLVIESICVENTGTAGARAYQGSSDNCSHINNEYSSNVDSLFINGSANTTISGCLSSCSGFGIYTNNFSGGTIINHTSVDCSTGFQRGTNSNNWVIKNSLYIGGGVFTNNTSWGAGSDYNASSDTTQVGSNSLINRTTADFVDYANEDYRTSSSSVLSTAGEGGTYIGFSLEQSSGGNVSDVNFSAKKPIFTASISNVNPGNSLSASFSTKKPIFSASINNEATNNTSSVSFGSKKPVFSALIDNTAQANTATVDFSTKKPVFNVAVQNEAINNTTSVSYSVNKPQFSVGINNSAGTNLVNVSFSSKKPVFNAAIDNGTPQTTVNVNFSANKPVFSAAINNTPVSNTTSVAYQVNKPVFSVGITNEVTPNVSSVDFAVKKPVFSVGIQNGEVVVKFNAETNYTQQYYSTNYTQSYLSTNYSQD